MPVSANIRNAADVVSQTVDVSHLLRYMEQAKGRSFLVVLDACRDDPFGGAYRPPAKGLSQFDAPVGSLLAFATAPGNVARDGEGSNGLYTSHLLREFAVRGAPIEDAFKRVRLNVRLASKGQQIPWESTSLEEDIYLFPSERKSLSEAEKDQLLEREMGHWLRVKSSTDPLALASFIREYPSGSASELAQARMNRLLGAMAAQEAQRMQAAALQRAEEAERLRLAAQLAEDERLRLAALELQRQKEQQQQAEREAAQRIEQARLATERARLAQQEALAAEERRQLALRVEQERQRVAQADAQAQQERLERETLARQQQEQQRLAQERARAAQEQRLATQRAELERQRLAQAQEDARVAEAQRLAAQRAELERQQLAQAQAQAQAERLENESRVRLEAERQRLVQAAARAAEEQRLVAQRAELERQRLAQAEEQARREQQERETRQRVAAEQDRQAREENQRAREQARAAEQQRLAVEQEQAAQAQAQAERARLQAQEAQAAVQRLQREQAEQTRQEALRAERARLALAELAANAAREAQRLKQEQQAAQVAVATIAGPEQTLAPTPFFKGYAEHQRHYSVGDQFDFRVVDHVNRQGTKTLVMKVTQTDLASDRVVFNDGEFTADLMGNTVNNRQGSNSTPRQFYPAELVVGKRWETRFKQSRPGGTSYTFQYKLKVVGKEMIDVPAGRFEAFRIEAEGFNLELGARLLRTIWVVPGIDADIAQEYSIRLRTGVLDWSERTELVSYKQAAR